MTHIAGFERDQLMLLQEAVDDYVDAENPARFIEALVDGLNLVSGGFARVEALAQRRDLLGQIVRACAALVRRTHQRRAFPTPQARLQRAGEGNRADAAIRVEQAGAGRYRCS
jgi:hypothetical protein